MQRHTTGADAWLQALDESVISRKVGLGLHTAGEVWYLRLPCLLMKLTASWATFRQKLKADLFRLPHRKLFNSVSPSFRLGLLALEVAFPCYFYAIKRSRTQRYEYRWNIESKCITNSKYGRNERRKSDESKHGQPSHALFSIEHQTQAVSK